MANDEFDNSKTDKEMLERFNHLEQDIAGSLPCDTLDLCGLMARLDTAAFMAWVPIRRKIKNDVELDEFQLMTACTVATCAVDGIALLRKVMGR